MNEYEKNRDRLLELLADQALFGLDPQELAELETLQKQFPDQPADALEKVAAMVELSGLPADVAPLPDSLRSRIQGGMAEFVRQPTVGDESGVSASSATPLSTAASIERPPLLAGWDWRMVAGLAGWAIAACLLLALALPGTGGKNAPKSRSVAELRESLIDSASDLIRRDWQTTEDPAAVSADGAAATGDVVWSNDRQEGYLRISGLQANNPEINQYQLWIFDDDQEHPVDGGVFDIPAGSDEVLIPVQAKINVSSPTVFAVTVEKPGGVVVSKKERVPLLAPPA